MEEKRATDESDVSKRRICSACVRESVLHKKVDRDGEIGSCSYCGREGKTMSIKQIGGVIDAALNQHYELTPSEPNAFQLAVGSPWEREGECAADTIATAADIDSEPADDIREVLAEHYYDHESTKVGDECPYDENTRYTLKRVDDFTFQEKWASFESALQQEARFFSRTGIQTLKNIFNGVEDLRASDNRSPIVDAGPGQPLVLYRARVFQSVEKLTEALAQLDLGIGPPPWRLARAGRMNAQGIAVFYGASKLETALAEVRPPVGSQVVIAKFDIIQPIKLLDVGILDEILVEGSIFDPEHFDRLELAAFLEQFSKMVSRPVMPDDEPFDYLVTQALADYLANEKNLDGMVYPSAQSGLQGKNVVIFHHAARIEPIPIPVGMELDVHANTFGSDGAAPSYMISTKPRVAPLAPPENAPLELLSPSILVGNRDNRKSTLRIDLASLHVHYISGVEVNADEYPVRRSLPLQ